MIVEKINKFLKKKELDISDWIKYKVRHKVSNGVGWTFQNQFLERHESSNALRMSACGKCTRRLAYKHHGFPRKGKAINGRSLRTFWVGDITELMLIHLAHLSGVTLLGMGDQQVRLSFTIEGQEITGHPDGIVFNPETKEYPLLEVKSMSNYAFRKAMKGDINKSYTWQVNAYMQTLGLDKCVFLLMDTNSKQIGEQIIQRDPKIPNLIADKFKTVIKSDKKHLPPKEFEANEKGKYPWQCRYCPYWKICQTNAKRKLSRGRYILVEEEEKKDGE